MKSSTLITTTAVTLLLTSAVAAGPHGRGGKGSDHGERKLRHLTEILDLSEPQRDQVGSIFADARLDGQSARDQMKAQKEELEALLEADSADPAEVGALVIDLHQRRQAMHARHQQVRADIEAVLTPAQREKLDIIEELRSTRREHRMGRRSERKGSMRPGPVDGPGGNEQDSD